MPPCQGQHRLTILQVKGRNDDALHASRGTTSQDLATLAVEALKIEVAMRVN